MYYKVNGITGRLTSAAATAFIPQRSSAGLEARRSCRCSSDDLCFTHQNRLGGTNPSGVSGSQQSPRPAETLPEVGWDPCPPEKGFDGQAAVQNHHGTDHRRDPVLSSGALHCSPAPKQMSPAAEL